MSGYREAPAALKNSVVQYDPIGPTAPYVLFIVTCLVAALPLGLAAIDLSQTRVRCDRAAGSCVIERSGVTGVTSQSIPLASVSSAGTETTQGKNGPESRVVLYTPSGREIVSGFEDGAVTADTKRALDAFFESSTVSSIDVVTDPRKSLIAVLLILATFAVLVFGSIGFRRARIEVNWNDRIFKVIRTRWPFPSRVHDLPLDAVRDAVVTEQRGGKGGVVYDVKIRVGDHTEYKLTDNDAGGRERQDRTVAEIQELLRTRDAGGPTLRD